MALACEKVFAITELAEEIFSYLPPKSLLYAMQVNKRFHEVINDSSITRQILMFDQASEPTNESSSTNSLILATAKTNPYLDHASFMQTRLPGAGIFDYDLERHTAGPHAGKAPIMRILRYGQDWEEHSYSKMHISNKREEVIRLILDGEELEEFWDDAYLDVKGATVGQLFKIGEELHRAVEGHQRQGKVFVLEDWFDDDSLEKIVSKPEYRVYIHSGSDYEFEIFKMPWTGSEG